MHLLNNKYGHYETCILLERYQNEGENLLNNIITIYETWVRAYEPELKRQSAEWRHEGVLSAQYYSAYLQNHLRHAVRHK